MSADDFWSLENYWSLFEWELKRSEPLANWPHLSPLLYFAFYAGAGHIMSAIAERGDAKLIDMIIDYQKEHLAAMTKLSPRREEARLRLPSVTKALQDLARRKADPEDDGPF